MIKTIFLVSKTIKDKIHLKAFRMKKMFKQKKIAISQTLKKRRHICKILPKRRPS